MESTDESVQSPSLQRGSADGAGLDAASCSSSDAFLQSAPIAWAHLQPRERKAVRACCRSGRQLHDHLVTDLRIRLGQAAEHRKRYPLHQPTPAELGASLGAVLRRCARLHSLTMWFRDPDDDRRQAQLLAALEACSGSPLTRLELVEAMPLSGAVVEAVGACCPHLSHLVVSHRRPEWPSAAVSRVGATSEDHNGCAQLLTLCGPRLRVLRLLGVHHWKAASYTALLECTALKELELDAGRNQSEKRRGRRYIESPAMDTHILDTVAQLTTLQSLSLQANFNSTSTALEAVRPHAASLSRLSALTALCKLRLVPSPSYDDHNKNGSIKTSEAYHGAWCAVREVHRASLLSALRCMPRLQHLDCLRLWLQPSELAALTTLTSVSLWGLLPPTVERSPGREDLSAASVALPPHLQELELGAAVSPRALALLQPSSAFSRLRAQGLLFGTSDVTADGRLRAKAVAAVGPAVRLLTTYHDPTFISNHFSIDGGRLFKALQPRAGSPTGHVEWIRQLQGLDVFGILRLQHVTLRAGDLSCLGQTLSNLTGLELRGCSFPVVALPSLRNPMPGLRTLEVDIRRCAWMDESTLEPLILTLLCQPPTGSAQLARLAITGCDFTVNTKQLLMAVEEQLQANFGVTGVALSLRSRRL